MNKTGNLIRTLRISKGLTQSELAGKFDITDKAVGKWEQGLGLPDLSLIQPIAKFFGITTDELLNGELNEVSTDITKSIYEKIVLSGLDRVGHFIKEGININGVDEYDKSIIDYIYQYQNIEFLNHAIKSKWLNQVKFQFTERVSGENNRGHDFILRSGQIYISPSRYQSLVQAYPVLRGSSNQPINLNDSNGHVSYSVLFDHEKPFEYDLINILKIAFKHQDKDLLKSIGYYQYFFSNERSLQFLESYVSQSDIDDDFFNDIIIKHKNLLLDNLLFLAVQNENQKLITKLIPVYEENPHSFPANVLECFIKYNHPLINRHVLNRECNLELMDIKLIYQFNKNLFDILPEWYLKSEYPKLSEIIESNDLDQGDKYLFLDPKMLIESKRYDVLSKHLAAVQKKNNDISDFIDELVQNKHKSKEEFKMSLEHIKSFNKLFKKYFIYKPSTLLSEDESGGILKPVRQKEEDDFQKTFENHLRLENIINMSKQEVKQYVYDQIEHCYQTKVMVESRLMNDELLLILAPYLNAFSLDLVLNNYNKENRDVLKSLLKYGGRFYNSNKPFSNYTSENNVFDYHKVETRTLNQIKTDQMQDDTTYDFVKTMQLKMLLGVE